MRPIRKVAVFGATGNFGNPITLALKNAGFKVTIFTRQDSNSIPPEGFPVIKTNYNCEDLTTQLLTQDAVINVLGPAGVSHAVTLVDAAIFAGVKRFIINDFGWGPDFRSFPEFEAIHATRTAGWDRAKVAARIHELYDEGFSWTGISIGNPIDWALRKFPAMGFDVANCSATIYDEGAENFTGTTLEGIGQAVVGVLQHPEETRNQFVKVRSIKTNQKDLLEAFEKATGRKWSVQKSTSRAMKESGQEKFKAGTGGWVLELVVAQLFDPGEGRCVLASERQESDAELLGVAEESVDYIVAKVLEAV